MNWKKLLADKSLQPKTISADEADSVMRKAHSSIKAAKLLIGKNLEEPAFKEAYDSMILSSRALIFSLGFKPRSVGTHSITIRFCELYFGEEMSGLISKFKKLKQKRNYLIYGAGLVVSKTETRNAIKSAEQFLKTAESEIHKIRKQQKLL
jgi:uncharacterized protein (UPF0332 family)